MNHKEALSRIKSGILILLVIVAGGTIGYIFLEDWHFLDAFYMTIISVTTTGFMEVHPLTTSGRLLTISLIIAGVSTIAYTGGSVAQLLIEAQLFRRRIMSRKLEDLKDHYIVCGFGRLGKTICEELEAVKYPFVVIEKNSDKIESLIKADYLFIGGDAIQDEQLLKAGIKRAKGLVAILPTDTDNVFTTLSAKVLNPNLFVVTRAVEEGTAIKLKRAGADRIVKPYEIGAHRMVHLLLRPGVVDFMDIVSRKNGEDLKLEEIVVKGSSSLTEKTLEETCIRRTLNIIIVALMRKSGEFLYNPTASTQIIEGDRLIAIGQTDNLNALNELCEINPKNQGKTKVLANPGV